MEQSIAYTTKSHGLYVANAFLVEQAMQSNTEDLSKLIDALRERMPDIDWNDVTRTGALIILTSWL